MGEGERGRKEKRKEGEEEEEERRAEAGPPAGPNPRAGLLSCQRPLLHALVLCPLPRPSPLLWGPPQEAPPGKGVAQMSSPERGLAAGKWGGAPPGLGEEQRRQKAVGAAQGQVLERQLLGPHPTLADRVGPPGAHR